MGAGVDDIPPHAGSRADPTADALPRSSGAAWQQWDIGVPVLLAALLWAAATFWPTAGGAWRVALGLIVMLAVPGYLFVAALFPGAADLDGLARAALTLVLGACLVILLTLVLAEVHIRLTAASTTGGILAVSAVSAGVAAWRRWRLPVALRFRVGRPPLGFWAVLALAVGLAVITTTVVGGALRQRSVAFYVTGPHGHLEGYPYQIAVGAVYRVGLHVSNPTPRAFTGQVTATANGGAPFLRQPVRLAPDGRWFAWVRLPAGPATGHEVVRFYLYRAGGKGAFRALWVRYTVVR